jgi:hypothetical protein
LAFASRRDDGFRFISDGGVLYTSRTPTGAFESAVKPPEPLRLVEASGDVVMGVSHRGAVYHFSEEWRAAELPNQVRGLDLGIAKDGSVLLLGLPEQLLVSRDAGRSFGSFSGAQPKSFGAHSIAQNVLGEPLVTGVSGALTFKDGQLLPTREVAREVSTLDVALSPVSGPNLDAIALKRATVDGSLYVELSSEDGMPTLLTGPFAGELQRAPLEALSSCSSLKLAAKEGTVVIGCFAPDDGESKVAFYSTSDRGKSLIRGVDLLVPVPDFFDFDIDASGALLVVGACRAESPEKQKEASGMLEEAAVSAAPLGCAPRAPIVVRGTSVTVGAAPDAEAGTLRSPRFSREGRLAYALGRKRRTAEPAVFVSRDGGRSYRARVIENPSAGWDANEEPGEPSDQGFYVDSETELTMDESGLVGMRCARGAGECWLTFDSEGRVANIGQAPELLSLVLGRGARVFGLSAETGVLKGFESLDGGASWSEVSLSDALRENVLNGGGACFASGCVFSSGLVREGWEGQEEKPVVASEAFVPQGRSPTIGLPFACEVPAKAEVTRILGRGEERGGSLQWSPALPRLRDLGRGKTAFSVLAVTPEGAVDVHSMPAPDTSPKSLGFTKRTLLKPPKAKALTTQTVRWQIEGYAAVRATVPTTKGSFDPSKKLSGLEVAWQNQFSNTTLEKRVDLDVNWSSALTVGSSLRLQQVSVAGVGLFVQPSASSNGWFVTAQGLAPFEVPNVRSRVTDRGSLGVLDTLALGSTPFSVAFLTREQASIVAFAPLSEPRTKSADGPQVSALAFASEGALMGYTYRGSTVGITAIETMPDDPSEEARAFAAFFEDGALGARVELPSLEDLPARPRACSLEERLSTPRSVVPFFAPNNLPLFAEPRSPVVVQDSSGASASLTASMLTGPQWMLLDGAVLYGSRKDPCVAFYRASGLRLGSVAVISGDLQKAWLLQTVNTPQGGSVEVKPMACRTQPDLPLPQEVFHRVGHRLPDDLF